MKYKMKTIFGVKSNTPINQKLKNGHTMYDWVVRKNCYPSFCMRTLTGENKITAKEIEYLKEKGCKIGLVLNDLAEAEVSSINAVCAAQRAVTSALELGVPANLSIAIFAEIKPEWSVNHNWMISFASALKAQGFVAGFIGNTDSSKNFNFDRQCSHYVQATKDVNYLGALFMATEPKCDGMPTEWTPYCPSAMEKEDISFWACGSTSFGEAIAENIYAKDKTGLVNLW